MKDNEIVELFWSRDESAISAAADTYGNYCLTIAYNILGSREDAEECVNDTYLKAWNSIPPQRPTRLSTYLGKITRNLSIDRMRLLSAKKRGQGMVACTLSEFEACMPASVDIESTLDEIVLVTVLENFLRQLPRTQRNIFVGRYWYLYSIRDLATAYSMSESKIASLLFRLRNKLKLHLEKEGVSL